MNGNFYMTSTTTFQVKMFSGLELGDGSASMTQDDIRSDMAVKLLAYLLLNHDRSCSITELSEALWPDGVSVNPTGALKNLAYRLRNILKKVWPDEKFILTGRGSYAWNARIPLVLDSEIMEDSWRRAEAEPDVTEKIKLLNKGFEQYKGRFLADFASEHWIVSRTAYFETMFLDLSHMLAELLNEEERYDDAEKVCKRALELEPLDEPLHVHLISTYLAERKTEDAETQYHIAEKLLYDHLGIGPSEALKKLYDKAMEQSHKQQLDLGLIQDELKEERLEGAFYCDYGIFKKVYELDARRLERMGMTVHLSLLTLYTDAESPIQEGNAKYLELMEKAMRQMKAVVIQSLRSGDIFTRYSVNQYLIMLPSCPYEQAKRVMERIFKNYEQVRRRAKVRMQYSLKAMDWMERRMDEERKMFENPSTLHLCIDGMHEDGIDYYGSLSGVGLQDVYPFSNSAELMIRMEELLNQIGRPQASGVIRSFKESQIDTSYRPEPHMLRSSEEVEQLQGNLSTFKIKVQTRYHSCWQGLVFSTDGKQIGSYNSDIELMKLLSHTLHKTDVEEVTF